MGKNSDSVGESIAKSTLGSLFSGAFHTVGKALGDAWTGRAETTKGKSSNALDVKFNLLEKGIVNRICNVGAAQICRVKDSEEMSLVFEKNFELTGEQLEYILTGKEVKETK